MSQNSITIDALSIHKNYETNAPMHFNGDTQEDGSYLLFSSSPSSNCNFACKEQIRYKQKCGIRNCQTTSEPFRTP